MKDKEQLVAQRLILERKRIKLMRKLEQVENKLIKNKKELRGL